MARNYLCVNYLLNVRAANGEHGELGSGWYTGSCAPPTLRPTYWGVFVDGKDEEAMLVLTSDSSSESRALQLH